MLNSGQNDEVSDPLTGFPIKIGTTHLLSEEQNDERSVATGDHSSNPPAL